MNRPKLDKNTSVQDFKEFYWLKEELVSFCKEMSLPINGGKMEVAHRIEQYLASGSITTKTEPKKIVKSNFDWNTAELTSNTKITDSYKNTENVRAFFVSQIGAKFAFNVVFMNWMKVNIGLTLADATIEWNRICELKKSKVHQTEIAPQFEYNQYMRSFLTDNPDLSSKDAIRFWKLKSAKRGTNQYEKSDLDLI